MILFKLKKKYSKTYIIFEENLGMDPVDKWFIDIKRVTRKYNIKNKTIIIRKDIDIWKNNFLKDGWEIFED